MNPLILTNAFASVHIGVKQCFCGKPTVEDHDFCFCSPDCARADSLRALGGQGDCHYRNVMRRACANSAAPEHGPRRPFESRNESVVAQQSPPPQRTLKHSLPSKPGLNKGVRGSIFAMFRKQSQQTAPPSTKIRRESSVTGAILQEMEEEDEEEATLRRLLNHTEDRSRPPTLAQYQARQTTATRRSGVIRRSASFAGFNSQIDNRKERGSVMETLFQLRQAWNGTTDIMPDFDERSDEEY
ncbi:hypothetical protein EDB19DRAFT_1825623 [Suillus lakei]|nr:hypothetical protein EDB19DRAFT_1825623 [Suillus lakei]